MVHRWGWFLVVLYVAFAGPWWLFVPLGAGYVLYYGGAEILLLTLLVDSGYGQSLAAVPLYTLAAWLLLLLVWWLQPRLSWYQQSI